MAIRSEQDFIQLVKKAEQDADANIKSYTVKLALFALLGYLVIFLVLIALLGLAGGLVATVFVSTGLFLLLLKSKLIFGVALGIWVLLRALWVKLNPPQGYVLARSDFPVLFAELDALSAKLKSLKIHQVILGKDFNAAVVQHPRLGVLGWNRNYLLLGYQLLLTLSPEEMRSVLAHEFGHLSANHSRFGGWIYRVRQTWMRVMAAFDGAESWGGRLMRRFFDWYSPRFEAYSFALARSNEYQADAIAAELTSAETATHALVNVHVTGPHLDRNYWKDYFGQADRLQQPPHAPFEGLARFLNERRLSAAELPECLAQALTADTHYADTHPSLRDRIAALGTDAQTPPATGTSAAEAWLGANNRKVMQDFDSEWLQENTDAWEKRYAYVSNARRRLSEFAATPVSELNDQDLWSYASWTNEFDSGDAALPLYRAYQERHPADPDAAFFIGMQLLENEDAAGIDQLRLARKSAHWLEQATQAGYAFIKAQSGEAAAEAWWQESLEQNAIFVAARAERASVTARDSFACPEIDPALLQRIVDDLKKTKGIGRAWLAQKQVRHFPDEPVYVIAFTPKGFHLSVGRLVTRVADKLSVQANIFLACKAGNTRKLAKRVAKAGQRII